MPSKPAPSRPQSPRFLTTSQLRLSHSFALTTHAPYCNSLCSDTNPGFHPSSVSRPVNKHAQTDQPYVPAFRSRQHLVSRNTTPTCRIDSSASRAYQATPIDNQQHHYTVAMKSTMISSVLLFLVALPFAVADSYDTTLISTVYSTKTVYAVHTEIKTGTPPVSSSCNSTSTYYPTSYGTSAVSSAVYPTGPATGYYPSSTGAGTPTTATLPTFTGAASQLNVNALVAAIAAGVGYLAL